MITATNPIGSYILLSHDNKKLTILSLLKCIRTVNNNTASLDSSQPVINPVVRREQWQFMTSLPPTLPPNVALIIQVPQPKTPVTEPGLSLQPPAVLVDRAKTLPRNMKNAGLIEYWCETSPFSAFKDLTAEEYIARVRSAFSTVKFYTISKVLAKQKALGKTEGEIKKILTKQYTEKKCKHSRDNRRRMKEIAQTAERPRVRDYNVTEYFARHPFNAIQDDHEKCVNDFLLDFYKNKKSYNIEYFLQRTTIKREVFLKVWKKLNLVRKRQSASTLHHGSHTINVKRCKDYHVEWIKNHPKNNIKKYDYFNQYMQWHIKRENKPTFWQAACFAKIIELDEVIMRSLYSCFPVHNT